MGTPSALHKTQVSSDLYWAFITSDLMGAYNCQKNWPEHLTLNRITYWLHRVSQTEWEREGKRMRMFGNMGGMTSLLERRGCHSLRDLGVFECKCNKIPAECQVISYQFEKTEEKDRHHCLTTIVASSFELLIHVRASPSEVLRCDFLTVVCFHQPSDSLLSCSDLTNQTR